MNILKSQRKNHMLFVSHTWSKSYLMSNAGAHYRKLLRLLSKRIYLTQSDWVGNAIWGSPIVSLAPPINPLKYGTPRKVIILPDQKNGKLR